jgi:Rrf2 family cysteine metabolism transcriptional repressor
MKLPRTEDTAILLVSELAENYQKGPLSLAQIAKKHGLSFLFLKKLARCLKQAGLIISSEGVNGGYELARFPQTINVWEVIEAVSPVSKDQKQHVSESTCPLNEHCLPQIIRQSVTHTLKTSLSAITLVNLKE